MSNWTTATQLREEGEPEVVSLESGSRTCTPTHQAALPPQRDAFIHSRSCCDHPAARLRAHGPRGFSGPCAEALGLFRKADSPHPFGHSPLQSSSVGDLLCACTTLDVRGKGLGHGPCPARTLGPVEKEQTCGECRNVSPCRTQWGRNKACVRLQGAGTHRDLNRTARAAGRRWRRTGRGAVA